MTSGNDKDDPGQRGPEPDWWQQGTPAQDPNYAGQQSDPTLVGGYTSPPPTAPITGGQYPQDPHQGQPYTGPQPYPGQSPYQSGPQPYQSGPQPYPGQPQQFGQPGYPQPYPPQQSPGGGKGKIWLFAGIGVLVLAIIGAVTVALVNRDSSEPSAQSNTTPSLISALTPTKTSTGPTTKTTTTPKTTGPAAVVPGYQVVTIPDNGAAYDIPKNWTVDRTGQSTFDSGGDSIPIAGLAQDGVGYCPNYVRTNVFLTQSTETDPTKAATDIGERMGRIGWSPTSLNASTPEPFSSTDNALHGVYAETTGTFTPPDPTCASTYAIYTFALGGESGALVLTIAADTGVDRAVNRGLARRLLATFRLI
ncbi:hypothetical protein [Nocardia crassostreae]|uniref:hypothetical protein n=1 Tax=Nocardia crassostreae TaxID=53428 RepID=UPI000833736F|nr:hypothetical protein [Nocardia crassostreae]